jgi:hypothetical protein
VTSVVWPRAQTVDRALLPADAIECWSVTEILKLLEKPGLTYWFQQQVARTAWNRRTALDALTEREATQLLLKRDNWTQDHELSDAQCGSAVHAALEAHTLGDVPDVHPEAQPFVKQFYAWLDAVQPEYQAAEATVFHPELLYAGTLDALARIDGQLWLIDYKTTRNPLDARGKLRGPYSEWLLQLAAYRFAPYVCAFRPYVLETDYSPRRYYISPQDMDHAVAMPKVDGCMVLQLEPNAWRMYPARVGNAAHDAFLQLRSLQRYLDLTARGAWSSYVEGKA